MPLPKTGRAELARHLDALGVADGDRLAVHSRLLSFGDLEGGAAGLAAMLRDRVGAAGSLVVPSYTFDPALPYDPRTRPGEATGALSEHVRQLPGARRSRCPIHNHAGIGPDSRLLDDSDPGSSLGEGSDFDHMMRRGFKLLLLGCGFSEGCTYLHHVEALANVPYRRWVWVERRVVDSGGHERTVRLRYFARSGEDIATDFEPAARELSRRGQLRSAPCAFGGSHCCLLSDLHAAAMDLLAADPHALTRRE
ncbi:AAC(3) family N-acetyltransferase [Magnetospirillum sp. SS-4]|uniref:AAC(3) family N-acetyltransferase n=1 Tax=Magnetospirillum sp. SS-4 TaxID=2681465 RepID=UPI00138203EC|nr:AAC(3) family N-acetyltransferase [Magnetospirillum sp. SS-4]CAA7617795.1 putative Aminoglycoside 3-N-acetyltransferase [Magnetospirillum sp. SS-4]